MTKMRIALENLTWPSNCGTFVFFFVDTEKAYMEDIAD